MYGEGSECKSELSVAQDCKQYLLEVRSLRAEADRLTAMLLVWLPLMLSLSERATKEEGRGAGAINANLLRYQVEMQTKAVKEAIKDR